MGQKAQTDRSPRGYITIDWMVLAVACIATLFLVGTMLRRGVDADAPAVVGLQELRGDDMLLAFQDFSFGAEGWTPDDTSDRVPGLGPVLGPFGAGAVQRTFSMPPDAEEARVAFDLHMLGAWSARGRIQLSLGSEVVLTASLPGGDAGDLTLDLAARDGLQITAQGRTITPRPAQATLPGATNAFTTLSIRAVIARPDETLAVRLNADVTGDARWTLDNVTVVATTGDGAE